MDFDGIPEKPQLPLEEEKVVAFWKEIDAFQNCLKQSKNSQRYTFYDGPPFATGLPHYGHILAGTVKDIVTRWAHQSGYHVERRFGWDCHGLPVEYEIDKKLGIKGPDDVAKIGIEKYNAECRKIIMRYSADWEQIMTRLGRWIDFKNDYKSMYPWYMESIWWVFKQLFDKGLVYKGFKVMPFSTACSTPLSNFETGQNYQDVDDPAVIISFPLEEDKDVALVAWTTTPWTLPSNLALCVHPEHDYVKIKQLSDNKIFILMEARLTSLYSSEEEYEVIDKFPGAKLKGKKYVPLFEYFGDMRKQGAFTVQVANYVTKDSGTGVVHQAPYFGEDDFTTCMQAGIISRDMKPICPIDFVGKFTDEVTDYKGMYIKDADKSICRDLKKQGRLVNESRIKHSYPFCWRSDTPLIYRSIPSWFVRVESFVDKLLANNNRTYWVPDFVREGRFANWLKDARDWAISRNRYWGTPIPLWTSDDGEEVVCIGSIDELKQLSGVDDITDLHREYVDKITIPSKQGRGVLRRVPEVFDCWFESGSMPYAQKHYPFENKKEFEETFPGDFIAEGIDQTRGWFYTLLVLSTGLFGRPPFKNLICHGLVLAADGSKMSKRKKNYPDPMDVVGKHGADAIRLYLVNSPVVRAESLKFKEEGVRDIVKDVFLPWFNAFRFLMQNINRLQTEDGVEFVYNDNTSQTPDNYMDQWILSFTQSLIKFVKQEMKAYRLYTVVPRLVSFVEELTNWYVRMNRKRLKGEISTKDCQQALSTLFSVILAMNKIMAAFVPFLTEYMYQHLRKYVDPDSTGKEDTRSIHFLMHPEPKESFIQEKIELAVAQMQTVIDLGRIVRDRNTMPVRYPLKEIVVIHKEQSCLENVKSLSKYIQEELNVRSVTVSADKQKYGVKLAAVPNFKTLGRRLRGDLDSVVSEMKSLDDATLTRFQQGETLKVKGYDITTDDMSLKYATASENSGTQDKTYEAHSDGEILILLDVTPDQSMLDEGLAREVINRIQRLRKEAKLKPSDAITVYYQSATPSLMGVVDSFYDFIFSTIKQPMAPYPVPSSAEVLINTESLKKDKKDKRDKKEKEDKLNLELTIVKGAIEGRPSCTIVPSGNAAGQPFCRFVNVKLMNCKPSGDATGTQGTVLLENPHGNYMINLSQLKHQVEIIFGVRNVKLFADDKKSKEVTSTGNMLSLHGSTVYAYV